MTPQQARAAIVRVGRSLYERGLVHAYAGNLSVRLDDGSLLITPTDACLGVLDPARLAWVGPDGRQRDGDPASKTLALHRRIYQAAPQVACVLHTHSHHLVQLTLAGVWRPDCVLPPITPYQVMKAGPVPLLPCPLPGAHEVAHAVAAELARRPSLRGVLLERLGPVVWHADPDRTSAVLEELEATARLWLACTPRPAPLSMQQIQALCDRFGASWDAPS